MSLTSPVPLAVVAVLSLAGWATPSVEVVALALLQNPELAVFAWGMCAGMHTPGSDRHGEQR